MTRDPHSDDLNERELIGASEDDGLTLGSILAGLCVLVALGAVIWVVWL